MGGREGGEEACEGVIYRGKGEDVGSFIYQFIATSQTI